VKTRFIVVFMVGLLAVIACNLPVFSPKPLAQPTIASPVPAATVSPVVGEVAAEPTAVLPTLAGESFIEQPSATPTAAIPTITPTPTTPVPSATSIPTATPYGCLRPPEDYTIVIIRDEYQLNQRTLAMLEHAQTLYGGSHDFVKAITQGSYSPGLDASFGTHDGGGAVDLSVRDLNNWHNIIYDEFDAIILALRQAGFAAWVRDTDELYAGSPLHIHAIAIGDRDLSEAAQLQLTGPAGYFRGYNGLPEDPPLPDGWGEPVICPWMLDMGYADLR
jgi:hypothetical protein